MTYTEIRLLSEYINPYFFCNTFPFAYPSWKRTMLERPDHKTIATIWLAAQKLKGATCRAFKAQVALD